MERKRNKINTEFACLARSRGTILRENLTFP